MKFFTLNKNKILILFSLFIISIVYNEILITSYKVVDIELLFKNKSAVVKVPKKGLKYILQWTSPHTVPFKFMGVGQATFKARNCTHVNCYVTSDRRILENITMFDVIAFAGPELTYYGNRDLPKVRSPHQKYAYANIESSRNYPIYSKEYDEYFNWTWTYKLDSDSRWGYLVVRDINGTIIGPNKEMHWIKHEDMLPVPDPLIRQLRSKKKLAAWFVSNCYTTSHRETFVEHLKIALKMYNATVSTYGNCGGRECPRDNERWCDKIIQQDYYFYLAFENSFSEDYVTEKVLHGLQHYAVPIVYGGADYSRFLPPGSYINTQNTPVKDLAKQMYNLVTNFEKYVEYFRWTNHYIIEPTSANETTDDYCSICALVNDENKFKKTTIYHKIRKWWNR